MADELRCGFEEWMPCDEECQYFHTCTRNPRYDELRKVGGRIGKQKNVHDEDMRQ